MNQTKKWQRFLIKFDSKIEKQENGCWLWTGARRPGTHPYGKIGFEWQGQKIQLAHRFAWLRKHGELDPEVKVLHSCDNPPCVNPTHIYEGTPKQNTGDMFSRARTNWCFGDQHWMQRRPELVTRNELGRFVKRDE